MATVQEPTRPVSRYDRFVQQELTRAIRRVRLLDVARAGLVLAIVVMGYGLAMILLDKWLNLPQLFRQFALVGLLAFSAAYIWFFLIRPIRRAINPYYAAVQVEQTIPDSKNSLVNWLDLHDERLAPSIATALGERAAEDLRETDVQQAIRSNGVPWLAGITLGLVIGFIALVVILRTDQFSSLLSRAFSPFGSDAGIVKQTRIRMVTPAEGHLTVAINRRVTIAVQVDGRIPARERPDSLRLLVRYNPDDPTYDEPLPLEPSPDNPAEWSIILPPQRVRTGFWYKVVGGDDETPEYRVQVRSNPSIKRFELSLQYRPYLRWEARRSDDPNIEDYRGTVVTIDAVTNRTVREGKLLLECEGKHTPFPAEIRPDRPDTMRFRFTLEKDAKYRIWFTTTDDESNNDPLPYTVRVLQDTKPEVEFTSPEQLKKPEPESDLALAADDMLRLQGLARDDFGITRMTLRMKLDNDELKPRDYLRPDAFRLDTGGYMRQVEYKDDVDLMKLERARGGAANPQTGSILEYWLEATDNFDYPDPLTGPQTGSTRHFRVKILPPKLNEKAQPGTDQEKQDQEIKKQERDRQREEAGKEKAEHDKKHEQDRQKQSAEDRKQQEERERDRREKEQALDQKNKQNDNGAKQNASKPDPQNPMDGAQDTQKPEGANEDKPSKNSPEANNAARQIEEALKNDQKRAGAQDNPQQDAGQNNKSDAKPAEPDKPEPRPGDRPQDSPADAKNKPDNAGGAPDRNDPSQMKPADKPQEGGAGPGDSKSPPQNQPPQHGEEKKSGESSASPSGAGDAKKPPQDGADKGMGDAKAPPPPGAKDPMNPMGAGAQQDPKANPNDPGQAKGEPKNQPPNKNAAGNPNDPMQTPRNKNAGDGAKAENKPDESNQAGTAKKDASKDKNGNATDQASNQPRPDEAGQGKPKDGQSPKAQPKPDNRAANNAGKPNGDAKPAGADPKDAANAAASKPQPSKDPMGKGNDVAQAENKPDKGQGEPNAQKNDSNGGKEIAKLQEQMKNGDANQRQAAQQKLGEIARNDADPQKRQAAQEALKDAQKGQQGNEASAKSPPQQPRPGDPMGSKPEQVADAKNAPKDKQGQPGDQKPNGSGDPKVAKSEPKAGEQPRGDGKSPPSKSDATADSKKGGAPGQPGQTPGAGKPGGDSKDIARSGEPKQGQGSGSGSSGSGGSSNKPDAGVAQKNPMNPMGDPANPMSGNPMGGNQSKNDAGVAKNDSSSAGQGKGSDDRPGNGGGSPGNGSNATRQTTGGQSSPEQRVASNPNEDFKNRSGDLNLEKIDKKRLNDLLKEHKISPEEWERYLAEQKNARSRPAAKPRDLEASRRTEGVNVNTGARRIEDADARDSGQLSTGDTGQAPPEYRQAARKFAELLSKPAEPKKK